MGIDRGHIAVKREGKLLDGDRRGRMYNR